MTKIFTLYLVLYKGEPSAAYARKTQAEIYASGFSKQDEIEILEGTFTEIDPLKPLKDIDKALRYGYKKKQDKPLEIIGTDLQGNKLKPPFVKS